MGQFFPRSQRKLWHRRKHQTSLSTDVGQIRLEVWYGQDPSDGHWGCPIREAWGLSARQRLSPATEDKLAFTVSATGSYAEAAALARKWGCRISKSTLHVLIQRLGRRAEEQTQQRLKCTPQEQQPKDPPTQLGVLMIDGWQVRFRGEGWGKKKTKKNRVEWHELKTGVFYRHEHSTHSQSGRGELLEKTVVRFQGSPAELGERLNWEALRRGLGRAKQIQVVADGAPWIWNLSQQRWNGAHEVLDFYHASQHLWALARAMVGKDESEVAAWVKPRRHRLRHGKEKAVLKELSQLRGLRGERGKVLKREKNYFSTQAQRMNYQRTARKGWPIGSGAVESACRQEQCRFKRPGQFWTQEGLRNLCAITEARHNDHWDELWLST